MKNAKFQNSYVDVEFFGQDFSYLRKLFFSKPSNHIHFLAVSSFVSDLPIKFLLGILANGVNVCDSKPLQKSLGVFRRDVHCMRGTDFMRAILLDPNNNENEFSHFFLGSTDQVLEKLIDKCFEFNPGIRLAGSFSPGFGQLTSDELSNISQKIVESQAQIVWIALGSPTQDIIGKYLFENCDITTVCVGAAFEYVAETKKEAPRFLHYSGLEWLFRLSQEPRRLWSRYLFGNIRFILITLRLLLFRK